MRLDLAGRLLIPLGEWRPGDKLSVTCSLGRKVRSLLCGVTVLLDVEQFVDELPMETAFRLTMQASIPCWMARAAFTSY